AVRVRTPSRSNRHPSMWSGIPSIFPVPSRLPDVRPAAVPGPLPRPRAGRPANGRHHLVLPALLVSLILFALLAARRHVLQHHPRQPPHPCLSPAGRGPSRRASGCFHLCLPQVPPPTPRSPYTTIPLTPRSR